MVSKKLGDGETAADIIFSHRSKSYNKNVKVFRRGPEFLPQPLRVADNARPLICENLCNLQTLDLESINPSQWSEWDEYTVLGSRQMDCVGRWESDRAIGNIASQRHGRWAGI